jgi:CRP/FNR family transcriptional regulator, cyclic AMP receptor protein
LRARTDSKLEAFKRVPLFADLSRNELKAVAQLADELDLRDGKEVIAEGEPGRQFFVLLEGGAVIRRKGRKIDTLGPGDFFGEIALISGRPTTASVTTTGSVVVAVITRPSFSRLLRENPRIQTKVMQALADRIPGD